MEIPFNSSHVAGDVMPVVDEWLVRHNERLVEVRRDLHMHPELGHNERRTTERLCAALEAAGLQPRVLPSGTGLICDVGSESPAIAIRADIDALPLTDAKDVSYRSTVAGVTHACGHDVHTTVVLGAALLAARLHESAMLPRSVRFVFQPAEEVMPGGAHDVIAAGAMQGITSMFAVHCDPSLPVGQVGLRVGALTSASDRVEVRVTGPGGHTARPHLTSDLVSALAAIVSDAPAALARRVDPRSGVALVWGQISAGAAANVIPQTGFAQGTLRTLDIEAWESAPPLLVSIINSIADAWGVSVEVLHDRGVPPVVNTAAGIEALRASIAMTLTSVTEVPTAQSLGGEDFGWYLHGIEGAMARLGVASPGAPVVDLHSPSFDVDERCIDVGVRLLIGTVLT